MRLTTLLILFSTSLYSQGILKPFKPTTLEYVSLGLSITDGISRGILEALHADDKVLERRFNLNAHQFGGSEDWQRNYVNNRYQNPDGSINKHKPEIAGNFGRDAHHTFEDISKISSRLGAASFGISATIQFKEDKKTLIATILKGLMIWTISSLTEKVTYDCLQSK